jgi:hypothetical protein
MENNFIKKKLIIDEIQKMNLDEQRQIFIILQKHLNGLNDTKWNTKNENGIFINLSYIDNSVINDIEIFINECKEKKKKMQEIQNEQNNIENKGICYKVLSNINTEKEDFEFIYKIIDPLLIKNMQQEFKKYSSKKNNLQTKFINASKRYTKSINYEKKFENSNFLDFETYNL